MPTHWNVFSSATAMSSCAGGTSSATAEKHSPTMPMTAMPNSTTSTTNTPVGQEGMSA